MFIFNFATLPPGSNVEVEEYAVEIECGVGHGSSPATLTFWLLS